MNKNIEFVKSLCDQVSMCILAGYHGFSVGGWFWPGLPLARYA